MDNTLLVDEQTEGQEAVPQSAREEKRELQTARILEAAKKCFVRSGFQGASMNEICKEAEMSPGALYRYFPSKEAIIEAIAEADRRKDAELLAITLENPDVVEGFVAGALAHIKHVHECGNAPLFLEIRAEGMRNSVLRECCENSMARVYEALHGYLARARDRGEINPTVDIDTLLTVMMAISEGLIASDLPARGISYEDIEKMIRASVTANLRPVKKIDGNTSATFRNNTETKVS